MESPSRQGFRYSPFTTLATVCRKSSPLPFTGERMKENKVEALQFSRYVKPDHFERMTGMCISQVRSKKNRGVWREGIHFRTDPDGMLWIDWNNVDKWIENENEANKDR